MDFIAEFKRRLKLVDETNDAIIIIPPTPRYDPPIILKLYNIHKRSLPVGIDKVVVFNVTKEEAEHWITRVLKSRVYENGPDDSKTLVYYDVVPINATPKERSIFYNPSNVIVGDRI